MTELQKALNKEEMPMILATKIVRESGTIRNLTDAKLVLDVFEQYEPEKTISEFVEGRKQTIKVFEGMRRIKLERGEDVKSIDSSLNIWKKELAKIKEAVMFLRLHKVIYGGE